MVDREQQKRDRASRDAIVEAMVGCTHRQFGAIPPGNWILEVGAGDGENRNELIKRLNGKRYVGVEAGPLGPRAAYVSRMRVQDCPESWRGRFHFIYARNALRQTPKVITALKRLLAPHGILGAITTSEEGDDPMADIGAWMRAYLEHGLASAYAVVQERESHLILIHDDWPLKD